MHGHLNVKFIKLQCCDIDTMWQCGVAGTSSYLFVFCTYCVYKHLCDPEGSRPDEVCKVWSGWCTRSTAVELAERQVQLKNSRSRSSAAGDHYAEISGGDSFWLEIGTVVGQRMGAFWEMDWAWMVIEHSGSTLRHCYKNQLMLYGEVMAVCSEIHTKPINALCGQNVELLNVKLAVHMVTTGL